MVQLIILSSSKTRHILNLSRPIPVSHLQNIYQSHPLYPHQHYSSSSSHPAKYCISILPAPPLPTLHSSIPFSSKSQSIDSEQEELIGWSQRILARIAHRETVVTNDLSKTYHIFQITYGIIFQLLDILCETFHDLSLGIFPLPHLEDDLYTLF